MYLVQEGIFQARVHFAPVHRERVNLALRGRADSTPGPVWEASVPEAADSVVESVWVVAVDLVVRFAWAVVKVVALASPVAEVVEAAVAADNVDSSDRDSSGGRLL